MPESQRSTGDPLPKVVVTEKLIREMREHHKLQLELCEKLETIADTLPDNVNSQDMLIVAKQVFPTVKSAHEFEENKIFPLVDIETLKSPQLAKSLERLRFEHWEDESFAQELNDGMVGYISGDGPKASDSLSYMLRGFFEGLRRHIAFEVEYIMPMLIQSRMSS